MDALSRFLGDVGPSVARRRSLLDAGPAPTPGRRSAGVYVAVGAGVAVAGVVTYLLTRPKTPAAPSPGSPYQSPVLGNPATTAPATAPTAIQTTDVTDVAADVSWTAPAGASYVELQHTDASGNPSTLPITVGGATGSDFQITTGSVTITGLSPNSPLHFMLRGCNAVGCGPWSAVQSLTTAAPPTPGAVTGISVTQITDTSAVVSWTPNPATDYVSYYEFMHTDASGNEAGSSDQITVGGALGNDFEVTGTSVAITGLSPNAALHFMIRACN